LLAQVTHGVPCAGIHATADGLSLLTAGADNRLRLWDACHLHHQLLHYSDTFNRGAFPKRMCSTPDGRYLFFPQGDDIQVSSKDGHSVVVLSG
jgi:WD40 repeat protein